MRLIKPLVQLPILFDAAALEAEVRALPAASWTPHPTGYPGNDAARLVSPGGKPTDALDGAMAPTEHLRASSYMQEVMAALGGVWGRSRLMGLGAGAQVPPHIDCHYYWRTHLRIHIPVITNPDVLFKCGGKTVHMKPGECWVFDSFQEHEVHNNGAERRVHLVLDTVGGERLWDLIDAAQSGASGEPVVVPALGGPSPDLAFERVNTPKVMSPWEMQAHLSFLMGHVVSPSAARSVHQRLDRFIYAWGALWARFETSDEGLPAYRQLLREVRADMVQLGAGTIRLRNNMKLDFTLKQLIFVNAVERPDTAALGAPRPNEAIPNVAA